jgi:SGNH domain (fused to AT3 domains)
MAPVGASRSGQDVRITESQYSLESKQIDNQLARIAAEYHATTIDPKTQLCDNSRCLIARDGRSLYRDSHHLTVFGALQLADSFRPIFVCHENLHLCN